MVGRKVRRGRGMVVVTDGFICIVYCRLHCMEQTNGLYYTGLLLRLLFLGADNG